VKHYLLVKRNGLSASGEPLDAAGSALALLAAKIWPMWQGTPNRVALASGDAVAVYLAGERESRVIAAAAVDRITGWSREMARTYPLQLDGTPVRVLHLAEIRIFAQPVDVRARLHRLSFVRPGLRKWGVYFTGGSRAVPAGDFATLTTA